MCSAQGIRKKARRGETRTPSGTPPTQPSGVKTTVHGADAPRTEWGKKTGSETHMLRVRRQPRPTPWDLDRRTRLKGRQDPEGGGWVSSHVCSASGRGRFSGRQNGGY